MTDKLPAEYLEFIDKNSKDGFKIYFKIEDWHFWPVSEAVRKTEELIRDNILGKDEFAIADNEDGQYLFYKTNHQPPHNIFMADESFGKPFFTFSIHDFEKFEKTIELVSQTNNQNYKSIDISAIKDHPGSVYWYAFNLMTSPYDDDYSEDLNQYAAELLKEAAEAGHPEAAAELADYYSFQDDIDIEEVIKWRKKSIELGDHDEKYELADFIIDNKPEDITFATSLLEELTQNERFSDRAYLKLSKVYMSEDNGSHNPQKAIDAVNKAIELGNFVAKADLAFYYYNGFGVDKDKKKAMELLIEANKEAKKRMGEEPWNEVIHKLKKEMD
ncbi:tetratricopeptide repeat protein [Mangrovivirga cuniculi]|uniref:Sel1 repeat family protein n=1 Tax=Mangrovivirga cuniculi TaxID=2715131 RepID=A0A4D7JLQ5_9BACT|nr:sel1 repeat family protein [Mangrovivirga cuniculi]QCK15813.1 hypothetical protein DCC35_14190 [Mangrovivirga cuniculi]